MYKSAARQFLSEATYDRAAGHWRKFRGIREQFVWNVKTALSRGWPELLVHFGVGPGDDMLCTVVLRELKKRGQEKIWMMSQNASLFDGNHDVDLVVPINDRFRLYVLALRKKWLQLEYAGVDREKDLSLPPQRHIIAELCWRAGVRGPVTLRPYFHLRDEEKEKAAWADGTIAIQSSGLGGRWPMQNKQWYPERFQQVVNGLKNKYKFIQLGATGDAPLADVTDLRGKTNLRETAALLGSSRLFIGNAGFMMHLARAVERPSVVIYGGREAPWQSGYTCNFNLYTAEPCAPCWLWNKCDYNRICMDKITAAAVIQAVEQATAKPLQPLVADECTL